MATGNIGVGSLKPDKVASRKTFDRVSGITPAGTSSLKFINAKVPVDNRDRVIPQQARES
jgi:hypothetical protein